MWDHKDFTRAGGGEGGEAHLYVFYVSGRLRGGTHSDDLSARVGPLERTSRVRGEGRGVGCLMALSPRVGPLERTSRVRGCGII